MRPAVTADRPRARLETGAGAANVHKSVTRALLALEAVAESQVPLSLSALAARLDVPKSTLHGLLNALVVRRYLERDRDGNYVVAVHTLEVGAAYLNHVKPLNVVHEKLVSLSRDLGITAHFAILDLPDVLYLGREDPPGNGLRLASALGTRLPAHLAAVGKANLAHVGPLAPSLDLDRVGSRRTPVTLNSLEEELSEVRRRGYAVDDGEILQAVRCVAAPVFEASGNCCGALGVSYLREGGPSTSQVAAAVMRAAARVSRQLGERISG